MSYHRVSRGPERTKVGKKHETYLDAVHAALAAAADKKGVACYVEDETGNIVYETMASAGDVRREMGAPASRPALRADAKRRKPSAVSGQKKKLSAVSGQRSAPKKQKGKR